MFTKGDWRIESDAQGACMIMHPTEKGKAIAVLTSNFEPARGFIYPHSELEAFQLSEKGTEPYAEREANAHLLVQAPKLYEACKAQHEAIDILFARLIELDKGFFPSKSGKPWEAMKQGNQAIASVEEK